MRCCRTIIRFGTETTPILLVLMCHREFAFRYVSKRIGVLVRATERARQIVVRWRQTQRSVCLVFVVCSGQTKLRLISLRLKAFLSIHRRVCGSHSLWSRSICSRRFKCHPIENDKFFSRLRIELSQWENIPLLSSRWRCAITEDLVQLFTDDSA